MRRKIRVGIFQFSIVFGDIEKNLKKVESHLPACKALGIELLVLPEMWVCGFDYDNLSVLARESSMAAHQLVSWSKNYGLVIVGSMPEFYDGRIVNVLSLVDPLKGVVGKYRKIHLFSPHKEHIFFERGDTIVVASSSLGEIGLAICYDLRFPELFRLSALKGAKIMCISALWPKVRVEHWELLLRARALENQLFVVGCNGCGTLQDIVYPGSSAIVDPWGTVVARGGEVEEIISGDIDLALVDEARRLIPCFSDRVATTDSFVMEQDISG